jgi:hypothetical protein
MPFRIFKDELKDNQRVESYLFQRFLLSLGIGIAIFLFFYFLKFQYIQDFIPKYGLFIILAILSHSIIAPSIHQIQSYKQMPCMSGMMVGMTIGMISGFLSGFYVGATNGMFIGSVFGMIVGIILGLWNGRCCGIMGSIEGTMAGFMAGPMGAMTAVMMLNDNLNYMAIIVFVIGAIIMFMLNYMIYKEMKSEIVKSEDSFIIFIYTIIVVVLTSLVMVFGPRGTLFQ